MVENESKSEDDSVSSREYVFDEIDVSSLIMEMVSSLERKPFTMSHRTFLQDETESLRFLFFLYCRSFAQLGIWISLRCPSHAKSVTT
jgi:hypothetical protein